MRAAPRLVSLALSALVVAGCGTFVRGEADAGSEGDAGSTPDAGSDTDAGSGADAGAAAGVVPGHLHLNLVWSTPGDPDQPTPPGSDLDLHLRHERGTVWNLPPWDCHPNNRHPDWGVEGENSDNPRIDRDAIGDSGPENINLDAPEKDVLYSVGIHYVSDAGFGPSTAWVVLRVDGEVVATFSDLELAVPEDFLHVADFRWTDAGFELWEVRELSKVPVGP